MIYVNHLSLNIKQDTILSDITLHVEKGKITGLVGRNGCGKTMLMKCITGFVRPTEGEVIFDGKKVGQDVDFPKNTGIIIESPSFIPYYSGRKNLLELASLQKKVKKERIDEVLQQVGLFEARNKPVRKYSLGMRQRLGIAQALMENPDTPISREQLLRTAWGYQSMGETRTVDVHVQRLRKKLGFSCIETVYRRGYKLRAQEVY